MSWKREWVQNFFQLAKFELKESKKGLEKTV